MRRERGGGKEERKIDEILHLNGRQTGTRSQIHPPHPPPPHRNPKHMWSGEHESAKEGKIFKLISVISQVGIGWQIQFKVFWMTELLLRREIARAQQARCLGLNEFEGHFKIRCDYHQPSQVQPEIHADFSDPSRGPGWNPVPCMLSDRVDG